MQIVYIQGIKCPDEIDNNLMWEKTYILWDVMQNIRGTVCRAGAWGPLSLEFGAIDIGIYNILHLRQSIHIYST